MEKTVQHTGAVLLSETVDRLLQVQFVVGYYVVKEELLKGALNCFDHTCGFVLKIGYANKQFHQFEAAEHEIGVFLLVLDFDVDCGQSGITFPDFGSRVFIFHIALWRLVRPSQDGEHAERLINTLFGAKHGGRHHQ